MDSMDLIKFKQVVDPMGYKAGLSRLVRCRKPPPAWECVQDSSDSA